MARTRLADVPVLWHHSIPFQCNTNLTGSDDTFFADTGMLPEEWVGVWKHSLGLRYGVSLGNPEFTKSQPDHPHALAYVVTSYRTPIAWKLNDGTVMKPSVHYSTTTSGHQNLISTGIYGGLNPADTPPKVFQTPEGAMVHLGLFLDDSIYWSDRL
jgi:hypothetical protein